MRSTPGVVALAKQIRVGRQSPFPQRHGEQHRRADQRQTVAERIGTAARQAIRVDDARRADHRLGAEPCGEDGRHDERGAHLTAGHQVVVLGLDAACDPAADAEHDREIREQAEKDEVHLPDPSDAPGAISTRMDPDRPL